MPGGNLYCDLAGAYTLLMLARQGFEKEITEGIHFHHASLDECIALLEDDIFEPVIQGAYMIASEQADDALSQIHV